MVDKPSDLCLCLSLLSLEVVVSDPLVDNSKKRREKPQPIDAFGRKEGTLITTIEAKEEEEDNLTTFNSIYQTIASFLSLLLLLLLLLLLSDSVFGFHLAGKAPLTSVTDS